MVTLKAHRPRRTSHETGTDDGNAPITRTAVLHFGDSTADPGLDSVLPEEIAVNPVDDLDGFSMLVSDRLA
jgi:hypothetical protein